MFLLLYIFSALVMVTNAKKEYVAIFEKKCTGNLMKIRTENECTKVAIQGGFGHSSPVTDPEAPKGCYYHEDGFYFNNIEMDTDCSAVYQCFCFIETFSIGDYYDVYVLTRDAYLKAEKILRMETPRYQSARDAYVVAAATYTKSLYERH